MFNLVGCSLKGSIVEQVLEDYLNDVMPDSLEALAVRSAHEAVRDNIILTGPDRFKYGPCAEHGDV